MPGQDLAGIRVVDFSHSWASPHASRLLADAGAEVLRIEYVPRLCMVRGGRVDDKMYDKHPMWFQVNRGKRSITLDHQRPRDREILHDLIRKSDVVVECARGGVMERIGLAWDDLREMSSRIILLSMAAYGKSGPWSRYAGYGGGMEALGGIQNLTGYADADKPSRVKEVDVINGLFGACAVMTAVLHRRRTGRGQWIDMSQMETAMHAMAGEHFLEHAMLGTTRQPMGARDRRHAPQGVYRCAGDDRWITLSVRNDNEWRALCEAIGDPALSGDPRYATAAGRRDHHDELDKRIGVWTASQDDLAIMRDLQRAGIAAGSVLHLEDLTKDPQLEQRQFFVEAKDGTPGRYLGNPLLSDTGRPSIQWRGPALGRDNAYACREILGRADDEIGEVETGRIGTAFDP